MVPRTHDIATELGHGDSIPNQDKQLKQQLDSHAKRMQQYESDLAVYNARRRAYAAGPPSGRELPYQVMGPPPTPPEPLSDIAEAHKAAGGGKDSRAARNELARTMAMRTLVASLWTYDDTWSVHNTPVAKKADEERLRHAQEMKVWKRYQAEQTDIRARNPLSGDWGGGAADARLEPLPPINRSKEIRNTTAQRYREIYIHSKLMIIDDSMFTLGSANLNLRSFAVDSEINIASDNAEKAKDLRQRVWKQHTKEQFDGGGDATNQGAVKKTFKNWEDEASANLVNKLKGSSLSCFLVKFLDERTSNFRLA